MVLPNNQRQHRTSHAPKDVLPLPLNPEPFTLTEVAHSLAPDAAAVLVATFTLWKVSTLNPKS